MSLMMWPLWLAPANGLADEREATPAVVNPALRSALRTMLSLDGDWVFATDPAGAGEKQRWFRPDVIWSKEITLHVPGCWEAQGVGGPGNSTSVTPEKSIRPLRGSYVGAAWYRKTFTLPSEWGGKEIWLKIGGVHAQGWFWVNGTFVGQNACYCGTYKYNITDLVKPGKQVSVVAQVRNDVPSRKGLMGWIHRFGGLYRSVELDATSGILIDDANVVGDLDEQKAVVHVKLRSTRQQVGSGQAEVGISVATLDGAPAGTASGLARLSERGTVDLALSVSLKPFRSWSPEEPNLYRADIVLKIDGQAIDGWVERFGVRKWEVRGGNFYLNNQRYFIRGFGDDHIYPLTLCSPASLEVHKKHLQLAKSYGFAYVRHHTHCEVPEFYDAADEVGIMIQPELPYYGDKPSAAAPGYFKPKEDLEELYTHYGRHVSLATYCTGNEGHLGSPIDREVYQLAKRLDPTRIALHQDGGANHKDNSDFYQGPVMPWEPGSQDPSWPFDAHEYLNLATQEDPRLADKYMGAVRPPVTREDFQKELTRAGLPWEWGMMTLDAGNQLQRVYQKRGIEQARLDPACDGYIYWTLVDVGSPSAQGLLNQFWEPKASTAEFFREFNAPTVIVARFSPSERIVEPGMHLGVDWWLSAFGAEPISGRNLTWRLEDADRTVCAGELPIGQIELGEVKKIGHSDIGAPSITEPAHMKLTAMLSGPDDSKPDSRVRNSWEIWAFPRIVPSADAGKGIAATAHLYALLRDRYRGLVEVGSPRSTPPSERSLDLLLAERLDRNVLQFLDAGKTVILLRLPFKAPGVHMGWWGISEQAGTAILAHPAFGDFPHEGYLSELLFRILGHTVSLNEQELHSVEPLMVTRGAADYLVHVFQAKAGNGKLFGSGLELLSEQPEAVYLLDQFIRYARSPQFQPRGTFDPGKPGKTLETDSL